MKITTLLAHIFITIALTIAIPIPIPQQYRYDSPTLPNQTCDYAFYACLSAKLSGFGIRNYNQEIYVYYAECGAVYNDPTCKTDPSGTGQIFVSTAGVRRGDSLGVVLTSIRGGGIEAERLLGVYERESGKKSL